MEDMSEYWRKVLNEKGDNLDDAVLGINLKAIAQNYKTLRDVSHPVKCGAVVKGNAYGCGMNRVSRKLYSIGCRIFFVGKLKDGIELRKELTETDAKIYVMNGLQMSIIHKYESCQLTPFLNSTNQIFAFAKYCAEKGKKLSCVIQIDVGMNRLGLTEEDLIMVRNNFDKLSSIDIELWLAHFTESEVPYSKVTDEQYEKFMGLLRKYKFSHEKISICNSAAIFANNEKFQKIGLNRLGIILYGNHLGKEISNNIPSILPVISIFSRIKQLKYRSKGQSIGYGSHFSIPKSGYFITVGFGFSDGLRDLITEECGRTLQSKIHLPIVGRVSMDLIVCDATTMKKTDLDEIEEGKFIEIILKPYVIRNGAKLCGTLNNQMLTCVGSGRSDFLYYE
ncbi:hypothetical protein SNEBB_002175 [Seison nebaliae]|nr:hypothetical protein SNEBB_002175 [Seison nebaliae]